MQFLQSAIRNRTAFTLTELVVASISASILLAALGSTMYIARQVAYSPVHAQKLLDGTTTAFDLVDELKHAVYIVDYGPTHLEFVTDDRDGDTIEDTIHYAWSGNAGDPLTRSFNRGAQVNVMDDVHEFQLDYSIEQSSEELEVFEPGGEIQLEPQYATSGNYYDLQQFNHLSQKVDLSGLPASARSWSLTKILFEASQSSGVDGQFAVQLRAAASDGTPTSEVVAEYLIDEATLPSSAGWFTLTPPQPVAGLSPHRNYCIVFVWLTGTSAATIYLSESATGAYQTGDDGATWSQLGVWAQVIVYAEPATASAPITVHEDRLRTVRLSLQPGDSSLSRVDTAAALQNAPAIVEKAWRAEFDRDPTLQDANGDGDGDFDFSGGTFDMADVVDGTWRATGFLRTDNTTSITTPVVVDVRGQSLGTGGRGLVARANVRLAANEYSDVAVSVVRAPDGTQTATLQAHDGVTTHVLTAVRELPAEPLDVRLVIEPTRRLAALRVEGVYHSAVSFPAVNATIPADSFYFTEDTSDAEYDYASIQITKDAQ